jgi:hypothetical protein
MLVGSRRGSWPALVGRILIGGILLLGTSSCHGTGMGDPFGEIALRMVDGKLVVIPTVCPPHAVASVTVVQPDPKHVVIQDDEPVVWRVTFSPPSNATSFVVGEVPAGGTEEVPLAAPLDDAVRYHASFILDGGGGSGTNLKPETLRDGRIFYHDEYMTEEQFQKARACSSATP